MTQWQRRALRPIIDALDDRMNFHAETWEEICCLWSVREAVQDFFKEMEDAP